MIRLSAAAAAPPPQLLHFFLLVLAASSLFSFSWAQSSDDDDDVAALLKFKSSITGGDLSSWSSNTKPPCSGDTSNWAHVRCSGGSVWSIQLKDMGLTGVPDVDSLSTIQSLRTLSLANNTFHGSLPPINKLTALKSAFLSYNNFSGEMPDDAFKGMMSLKKLHLDHNALTGKIPGSLIHLPKLLEVRLEGNSLSGQIPDFQQKLQVMDVSNNELEGPIPTSLSKMNSSYFSGNKGLCGPPLTTTVYCQPMVPSTPQNDTMSTRKAAIIAGVVVVGVLFAVVIIVLCLRKRDHSAVDATPTPPNLHRKASFKELEDPPTTTRQGSPQHTKKGGGGGEAAAADAVGTMKLTFVKEDTPKFDLQDLLKASAEILGSGCFGASYKAALLTSSSSSAGGGGEENAMVVKRFRQMNNVGKEEFEEHMRRLGKLSHPNLLPLVAYYYRKEEKLLVSEYVSRGSLALHLHTTSNNNAAALDWPLRLKLVKGVARGLVYLYNSLPTLIAPHGHLKSSNVLLNHCYEPLLHDYGLTPVINQEISQELMVAYKSPEYLQQKRITKKTDVWSLGILILEIITGRFPSNFLQPSASSSSSNQDQDQDLAAWVRSVGASSQIFDREMKLPGTHYDNDIIHLLNIALACCEPDVDKRLDIKEAACKIEEMKEPDDDFFSLGASDADFRSTRALSDDFSAPK